jgi:hypothetical protein
MVLYFNKKDLVKFGNYLLSEKRNESVSDLNKDKVTHADVENFLETIKKVE